MFVSACRWMLCKFDPKAADNIRALPNGPIPGVKCITGSSTTAATKTTTAAPKIGGIGGTGGVGIKNSAPTLNTGITASSKIGAQNLGVPKLGAPKLNITVGGLGNTNAYNRFLIVYLEF